MPATLLLAVMVAFADGPPTAPPPTDPDPDTEAQAPEDAFQPDPSWRALGEDIWFDPEQRRVVLRSRVVFREGPLEHLLCLRGTKEHESVLATAAPPRMIHAGLLLTGAEQGQPVQFQPEFKPPTGSIIQVELEWKDENGQTQRANGRDWVRDLRNQTPLDVDWVFAGSEIVIDPFTEKPYYSADDGDLITVVNFTSSLLDLPIASSASDADRIFVAFTERIPPLGTPVTMSLRPAPGDPAQEAEDRTPQDQDPDRPAEPPSEAPR